MGISFLDDADHDDLKPVTLKDRNDGPRVVNPKVALKQREKDAGLSDPSATQAASAPAPGSQASFSGYTAGAAPRPRPTPPASMLNNR